MEEVGRNTRSGTYVEGVGDEVVLTVTTILFIIIPLALYFAKVFFNVEFRNIHPENEDRVNNARNYLGIESETEEENNEATVTANGNMPNQNQRHFYTDSRCPICLQDAQLPVETNCGHLFCAQCIIAYWQHGNWLGAAQCPVCRQQVSLLMRSFHIDGNIDQNVLNTIGDYNRRFSGQPRPILDYIRDIPALLRNLWRDLFSVGGLVLMFRVRIALCAFGVLIYLMSPLDILPEAALGVIGLLDDIFVLLLVLIYVTVIYRNVVAERH